MDTPPLHALITGANRGLGLELTRQLLARGDRVVATCRQPGKAGTLNALAGAHPGHLHVLPLDVADGRSRARLAHELPLVLGDDGRIDLLINNAGVLHSGERFGHLDQAQLEDSLRINALGPLLVTEALAPLLADGARVANLSSQLGSIAGTARFGTPGYAIGKAAQNMATRLLAQALAERGIVVAAFHPGWVQTDMGGAQATEPVDAAASGLLDVIAGLSPAASGSFLDWRGETMAW
ncbi:MULTISPECIES: SDR family oxidoreductase [unclassified Luteimonas]|uniref:SDR family oxidoreductase n=1 Tax=unclassified Luteimonas TaxID=2629088 RepID=UPI0018F09C0D|nr:MULTISPECIES: SDR family oxidoreductase [unclassified Luteimonas]MBJ6982073.1 SDR family oxidoreductase [Luteimonas sp. MC1572]MBJ7575348.1 SDR family oxidoreductase [Luteimonas sp. MC1828]QQO03369.1 SDR family oxidoreductase [Luteimonas sp. MC1572]